MRQLVGKTVVWTKSNTIVNETTKVITKITVTGPYGFRVAADEGKMFNYNNGHEKTVNHRLPHGVVSKCDLVSEDDVQEMRSQFLEIKHRKDLIKFIVDEQTKLFKMPMKDLKTFVTKMKKVDADGFRRDC
jgi:hypothetical protein